MALIGDGSQRIKEENIDGEGKDNVALQVLYCLWYISWRFLR